MANRPGRQVAEPLHTEHIHVGRKKKTNWLWLLLLLPLLGLGVVALIMTTRGEPTADTPQGAAIVGEGMVGDAVVGDTRIVNYKQRQWEVKGGAETFPDGEVKLVGRSDEGDALYVHQSKGYMEGEGSQAVDNTISTPSGRVYLKNPDGRYQPLFQKP
ncbi:MAG: hypothetical protein ACK46X_11735 [Candidatus Sericytochromatia bacterium]